MDNFGVGGYFVGRSDVGSDWVLMGGWYRLGDHGRWVRGRVVDPFWFCYNNGAEESSLELRDYQLSLLRQCHSALLDTANAKIMLQLPTGGGKTRIAGALLSLLKRYGRKAVWITHRKELVTQTREMLREDHVNVMEVPWHLGVEAPSVRNGVVILMAQTVTRRNGSADIWRAYGKDDVMVIDEAHHAAAPGYEKAMEQWRGPVLGMTATPWRLSTKEGFDHLFDKLICGPQVELLQADGWLCKAKVLSPPEDEVILGGEVDFAGEYSEAGIERANRDRQVWTAGALQFWKRHASNRQTLAYAVSVEHAKNLARVFEDAEIPVGVLLGETKPTERQVMIGRFKQGNLRVLVNVAVATEGFDLPDASCVLITRPTLSLALYLQMVGRGMRPKPHSGDCVVLDMAGNVFRHGLPEENREWTLQARLQQPSGEAPVIRCENCSCLCIASSHNCKNCGHPFGEVCNRCGSWRAKSSWERKDMCGSAHEIVCDLCHDDAHVRAFLPETEVEEEYTEIMDYDSLSLYGGRFLRNMLKEERRRKQRTLDESRAKLRGCIKTLEQDFLDDSRMERSFEQYRDTLPYNQRPTNMRQEALMYVNWENKEKAKLKDRKIELADLESQAVDGQLVLDNVREKLLSLLEAEAKEMDLIGRLSTRTRTRQQESHGQSMWINLEELAKRSLNGQTRGMRPKKVRFPDGKVQSIKAWKNLMVELAEWLIQQELLNVEKCPYFLQGMQNYLICQEPQHPRGRPFWRPIKLSNGMYLESRQNGAQIAKWCSPMIREFGGDPKQISVQVPQVKS